MTNCGQRWAVKSLIWRRNQRGERITLPSSGPSLRCGSSVRPSFLNLISGTKKPSPSLIWSPFHSFKQPAKKVFKNLWKLILKPHIFMFLVVFFICGSVWGFLESYLFWFLEDLGSTKLTMGLSLAVGTIAGVPLTIGSAFIIGRLGSQLIFSFECCHLLAGPASTSCSTNNSGTTMWSCSPSLSTAFACLATPSSTHPWSPFSLRWVTWSWMWMF